MGRRTLLRWVALSVITIGSAAWVFMIHFADAGASFGLIALMAGIANFVTNAPLGVFVVYLNERFGTQVRAAGYSTAYTFGLILPGLYTVWVKGLAHVVPYAYTALFLIPLGGALVFLAAHRGPETLDAPLLGALGPGPQSGRARRRAGRHGRHAEAQRCRRAGGSPFGLRCPLGCPIQGASAAAGGRRRPRQSAGESGPTGG